MIWKAYFLILIGSLAANADDLVMPNGTVYKNAIVVKHDAVDATILCDDGGASVPIASMPPEWQKKLGYSDVAAKAQQESEASAAAARALDARSFNVKATILQVLPDGILAEDTLAYVSATGDWTQPVGPPGEIIYIECKSDGLADGQPWTGAIWRVGTYTYENTQNAAHTVEKFTTSRSKAASFRSSAALGN
jgi:hypothetical protein